MDIRPYTVYLDEEVLSLYDSVGWTNYTKRPEMLKAAYAASLMALGAYEDNQLVGIIRVVGDGASILYIQDIIVLPECQRRGIGKQLLLSALERYPDIYQVVLLTDDTPETTAFYQACGFQKDTDLGLCAFLRMKLPSASNP